jgi:outer membrane receptor protein involved in Fe transport
MKARFFPQNGAALSVMVAALAVPAHALAQEASQGAEESADSMEVVVTAQRREQRLQDVPVSVSLVDGEALVRSNLGDLASVAERQAGVMITPGPTDQLTIRGIGSGANNSGFEQAVATFVDGVYRSRARATRAALLDVERVEILKGPQTTFFGNNAIAGALNITTRKPGADFSYNAQALYGMYGEYNVEAGVTTPLTDSLSLRLVGRLSGINGYVDNMFTGDKGPRERNRIGRVSLAFKPAAGFRSNLRFDIGKLSGQDFVPFQIEHCPPSAPFVPGASCASYVAAANGQPIDDKLDYRNASPASYLDYRFKEVAWTNEIDVGDLTLNAITGYFDHNTQYLQHMIPVPVRGVGGGGQLPIFQREAFRQWSQEVRLQSAIGHPVEWQLGVYVSGTRLRNDGVTGMFFGPFGASVPPYTATSPIVGRIHVSEDSTNKSVFGAATLNPLAGLKINLGLRYSVVDKDASRSLFYGTGDPLNPLPENFVPGTQAESDAFNRLFGSTGANFPNPSRSDKKLMPSAGLQYKFSRSLAGYASYTRGFKAGGYGGGSTGGEFAPETVDAFEIGLKGDAFNRRLTFALSAFHSQYSDLQESLAEVLANGSVRISVANAASARSQGLELSAGLRLASWLTLHSELTYLDATYRDYPSAPCSSIQNVLGSAAGCVGSRQDLSGKRRSFAPEWSGNMSLEATVPVGSLTVRASPSMYFTSWFYQSATADDLIRQRGYAKFDMRLGIGSERGGWEVALIGKNLTDRVTASFRQTVSGGLGSASALVDRPRTVALQLTLRH